MNEKIYKKIAKKFGVSVEEVKREMQATINLAYEKPTLAAQCVPRKDSVPTPDEFINHAVSKMR